MKNYLANKLQTLRAWLSPTWAQGRIGKAKVVLAWYGLAVVVMGPLAAPFIPEAMEREQAEMQGRTDALLTKRLQASVHSPDTVTTEILQDVYELAHRYPNLQHVRIHLVVSASGVIDKYGNDVKEDQRVGAFDWNADDLAEMRKYRARHLYMTDSMRRAYEYKIRNLPLGSLLAR